MAFNLPAKSKRGLRQIPNWPAKFGIYYLRRRALPEIIAQESAVAVGAFATAFATQMPGFRWYGLVRFLENIG